MLLSSVSTGCKFQSISCIGCSVDVQSFINTPCFKKKTSTHIIGYKLRNSCPILIIFDTKIPHII